MLIAVDHRLIKPSSRMRFPPIEAFDTNYYGTSNLNKKADYCTNVVKESKMPFQIYILFVSIMEFLK